MRKFKVILSLALALTMLFTTGIASAVADSNSESEIEPEDKISDILKDKIAKSVDNKRIPVYIWYGDINQDQVDEITYERTGLTPQKCDVISPIALNESLSSEKEDTYAKKKFLKTTEEQRATEQKLMDTYIMSRRSVASEKYEEKSNLLIDKSVLNDSNIKFNSTLAPMIIAELSAEEIVELSEDPSIVSISYDDYEEIDNNLDGEEIDEVEFDEEEIEHGQTPSYPEVPYGSVGLLDFFEKYGLDGSGVKIGLVENSAPGIEISDTYNYDRYGFDSDNILKVTYNQLTEFDDIESIADEAIENFTGVSLKVITIAENANNIYLEPAITLADQEHHGHSHANNSTSVMVGDHIGIAKGARVYATFVGHGNISDSDYIKFANTEALVKCGINILAKPMQNLSNVALNANYINNIYKYYDHLVCIHNITVLIAAGDSINYTLGEPAAWVTYSGLLSNVICVGGINSYSINGEYVYQMSDYKWQNCDENLSVYNCEKPDIVYPMNFAAGATSTSTPMMAATIALIMELKPSLKANSHIVKAIILASCHKKANPVSGDPTVETMFTGIPSREHSGSNSSISEKQGAGIPNVMTMANIICQHTYGYGITGTTQQPIQVVQPSYNSTYINFSLAWVNKVFAENNHTIDGDILLPSPLNHDLMLTIYQNDQIVKCSNLMYSSTEMCYLPVSDNLVYGIDIHDYNPTPSMSKYAYAWSTDEMINTTDLDDGIYYIKNLQNNKYLYNNTEEGNSYLQTQLATASTTELLNPRYMWIKKQLPSGVSLCTGIGEGPSYLNVSNISVGDRLYLDLTPVECGFDLIENENGTILITNLRRTKLLRGTASIPLWENYQEAQNVQSRSKWIISKVNYSLYDANADGVIDDSDVEFVQRVDIELCSANNIQSFLGDINQDGELTLVDATMIQRYLYLQTALE